MLGLIHNVLRTSSSSGFRPSASILKNTRCGTAWASCSQPIFRKYMKFSMSLRTPKRDVVRDKQHIEGVVDWDVEKVVTVLIGRLGANTSTTDKGACIDVICGTKRDVMARSTAGFNGPDKVRCLTSGCPSRKEIISSLKKKEHENAWRINGQGFWRGRTQEPRRPINKTRVCNRGSRSKVSWMIPRYISTESSLMAKDRTRRARFESLQSLRHNFMRFRRVGWRFR